MILFLIIGALLFMGLIIKGKQRSAGDIRAAVLRIDPEHNPELQPGAPPAPPGGTWCNKFIAWVTSELGAPVPFGEYGTEANVQIQWLEENAAWYRASDSEAQLAALAGKVALTTYFNPNGHGHLALVLPTGGPSLHVAQAGMHNFNDVLVNSPYSFGSLSRVCYVHAD